MADENFKYNPYEGMSSAQKAGLILAQGAMAFGQGLTKTPYLSNFQEMQNNDAQRKFEQWKQSQPTTYTFTDPATGEPKSYTISSGQQPNSSINGNNIGSNIVPNNTTMGNQSNLPPGIAVINSGGKTSITNTPKSLLNNPAVESNKTLVGTKRFLEQFGRSYNELKTAYPEIGDVGYTGWATRGLAGLQTSLDKFPETKAFQVELQPLANQMARDVEGGRITDQDRKIYADAFANTLKNPSKTNVRLVSNSLLKLKDKGGDISKVVGELYSSDIDILQNISKEVIKSSPDIKKEALLQVYQNNPDRFEVVNE